MWTTVWNVQGEQNRHAFKDLKAPCVWFGNILMTNFLTYCSARVGGFFILACAWILCPAARVDYPIWAILRVGISIQIVRTVTSGEIGRVSAIAKAGDVRSRWQRRQVTAKAGDNETDINQS